ncbi:MAG: PQQ-dependent sugar dehydrogenase, partial [Bacteroidota bacterium]
SFPDSAYCYVQYTISDGSNRVSRFSIDPANPNQADPGSEKIILEFPQPFNNHNGGDLKFGPDGYLYIASGDGGAGGDPGDRAQDLSLLLGKILRIDINTTQAYLIPSDNPFTAALASRDEIWSYGWRNPWRISFDRQTGDMWIADVGQDVAEEINRETAGSGGLNYGWRCFEGDNPFNGFNCGTVNQYAFPVQEYLHSANVGGSVTGGFVYRGNLYPDLDGIYFYGDYVSGNVWGLWENTNGIWVNQFQGKLMPNESLSTFGEDQNGELYAAGVNGVVYKIQSTATSIEPDPSGHILLYPNPNRGKKTTLEIGSSLLQEGVQIRILDVQGRVHWQGNSQTRFTQLGTESLSAGVYLVEVSGKSLWVEKLIIR